MKKLVLLLTVILSVGALKAQYCNPDLQYTVPGVYPDSATNLAVAYVGVPYSQTITNVVPVDTCVVVLFPPCEVVPIDSIMVESVTGLPPGLAIISENELNLPFKYLGGTTSCMLISGTPTTPGHYAIDVTGTSWATVFTLPQSQPFGVDYYYIDVLMPTGELELTSEDFKVSQNSPNPVKNYSTIEYYMPESAQVAIQIRNILGETVYNEVVNSARGTNRYQLDATDFSSGVYFYQFNYNNQIVTKKFIVNK